MAGSLRATQVGIQLVDQSRRKKGWNKTEPLWFQQAFTSKSTLNRFWSGQAIRADAFIALCDVVGVNWQEIAETHQISPLEKETLNQLSQRGEPRRVDWSDAPDATICYGRQQELTQLHQWICNQGCRLIVIQGMGGMGKSLLASRLMHDLAGDDLFADGWQWLIWRSLRNAPPLEQFLEGVLERLDISPSNRSAETKTDQTLLLKAMSDRKGILILDNLESILIPGGDNKLIPIHHQSFRPGYENYGELLQHLGSVTHRSCVIVTSREIPKKLIPPNPDQTHIQTLQLKGIETTAAQAIFADKGRFQGSSKVWQDIISHYAGNPLALKIIATYVRDFFAGDLSEFSQCLQQGASLFEDIHKLLASQFDRLCLKEQAVMYWLAISCEPISIQQLNQVSLHLSALELLTVLNNLQQRSLIEKHGDGFTQQPVVMEYATHRFIQVWVNSFNQRHNAAASVEVPLAQTPLCTHLLQNATSQAYLQNTQKRLVLTPLIEALKQDWDASALFDALDQDKQSLQHQIHEGLHPEMAGYFAANFLHLSASLNHDLAGADLSDLPIVKANLQDQSLRRVDFSRCRFYQCSFTEALGNMLSAAFCPDGLFLATCDTDCHVRIWEVNTGRLLQICQGHRNWVRTVAFAPNLVDSTTQLILASGGADQCIYLWNLKTGEPIQVLTGHEGEVFSVAWHPQGHELASAGGDRDIFIWDRMSGTCLHRFSGHTDRIWAIAYSSDGEYLVSASQDQSIKLWDAGTGECLFTAHPGPVRSLAIHPGGHLIASGDQLGNIQLWRWQDQKLIGEHQFTDHCGGIYSLDFSRDGDFLVSGGEDQIIRIWHLKTHQCIRQLQGHDNQIFTVAFHPKGESLVGVSLDQSVRLWNYHTGQCLRVWKGSTDWVFPVAWHPGGRVIASGSNDHRVRIWDQNHSRLLGTLTGHQDHICAITFTAAGDRLMSASRDQTIRVWDWASGRCQRILTGHQDWVYDVQAHPSEPIIASSSADQTIRLWSLETGICQQTLQGHSSQIWTVAFSPDGNLLASGSTDSTIRLWNWQTGECIHILQGHEKRVKAIAFSPTLPILASASTDCTVRLWDIRTGQCLQVLTGHTNWVFDVSFHPNGQTLASASHDWSVRLWGIEQRDAKICAKPVGTLLGHRHLVSAVAFNPKGDRLASGSQDQTLRLWNFSSQTEVDCLRIPRLYEGMDLTDASGLTSAQLATLKELGAIIPKSTPSTLSPLGFTSDTQIA